MQRVTDSDQDITEKDAVGGTSRHKTEGKVFERGRCRGQSAKGLTHTPTQKKLTTSDYRTLPIPTEMA